MHSGRLGIHVIRPSDQNASSSSKFKSAGQNLCQTSFNPLNVTATNYFRTDELFNRFQVTNGDHTESWSPQPSTSTFSKASSNCSTTTAGTCARRCAPWAGRLSIVTTTWASARSRFCLVSSCSLHFCGTFTGWLNEALSCCFKLAYIQEHYQQLSPKLFHQINVRVFKETLCRRHEHASQT